MLFLEDYGEEGLEELNLQVIGFPNSRGQMPVTPWQGLGGVYPGFEATEWQDSGGDSCSCYNARMKVEQ